MKIELVISHKLHRHYVLSMENVKAGRKYDTLALSLKAIPHKKNSLSLQKQKKENSVVFSKVQRKIVA